MYRALERDGVIVMRGLFILAGMILSLTFGSFSIYLIQMPKSPLTADLISLFAIASIGFAIYTIGEFRDMAEEEED